MNVFLILIAALGFSAAGPATKIALGEMGIFTIVAGRSLIAAVVLALICNRDLVEVWNHLHHRTRWLLIGNGALLGVHLGFYVAGVKLTTYVSAMTLVCLEPIVVLMAGIVFFRIIPRFNQWLGIGLALLGTLVIGLSSVSSSTNEIIPVKQKLLGDLMLILATIQYGIYYSINRNMEKHKRGGKATDSFAYATIIYFAAALVAIVIQLSLWVIQPAPTLHFSVKAWGALLALGILPTLVGHTLAQVLARRVQPAWVALLAPGETLGAIILGIILFGSLPTELEWLGGTIIIIGALLVTLSQRQKKTLSVVTALGILTLLFNNQPLGAAEPTKIDLPPHYTLRKKLLFPLDLPGYIIHAATIPLGFIGKAIEEKHLVERTIDLLSNDERTFFVFPTLDAGSGTGFGAGIGLSHSNLFDRAQSLKMNYIFYQDADQRGRFDYNTPMGLGLSSRYYVERDEDFYGIGPDSLRSDKSAYSYWAVEVATAWRLNFAPHFMLQPRLGFRTGDTGDTKVDDEAGITTVFNPSDLPGFGEPLSHLEFAVALAYDNRDNRYRPEHGSFAQLRIHYWQDLLEDKNSFIQYDVEFAQLIPLFAERRGLLLRNAWVLQDTFNDNAVPFHMLATLDRVNFLRGFKVGRFRDQNSVIANLEYRYPLWDFIDLHLFFDNGKVFPALSDLDFDNWKWSYGAGIHFSSRDDFILRSEFGYGGETLAVTVTASKGI